MTSESPDGARLMVYANVVVGTDRPATAEMVVLQAGQLAAAEGATGTVAEAVAGSPADGLLEVPLDFAADLIVVGSRGLTGASGSCSAVWRAASAITSRATF